MRGRKPLLVLGNAIMLTIVLPFCAAANVPDWIRAEKAEDPPRWVSLKEAAPNGRLQLELFPEASRVYLHQVMERGRAHRASTGDMGIRTKSGNTCILWSVVFRQSAYLGEPSIEALFRESAQVYIGTITDSAQGFVDGFPGTLLEVSVENAFKDKPTATPHHLYVHFQHAEIQLGEDSLCVKSDRYPDLPEVGRRIFVFLNSAESESAPMLHASKVDLLYERADGTVSCPPAFAGTEFSVIQVKKMLADISSGVAK